MYIEMLYVFGKLLIAHIFVVATWDNNRLEIWIANRKPRLVKKNQKLYLYICSFIDLGIIQLLRKALYSDILTALTLTPKPPALDLPCTLDLPWGA